MLNRYPLWKYLLILGVLTMGLLYALPNLFPPDPAVQISSANSGVEIDERLLSRATDALKDADIEIIGSSVSDDGKSGLIRLAKRDAQLPAQLVIQQTIGGGYVVALNLAETTPEWLRSIGASPMKLGLDLSGGVHFLLEVDIRVPIAKRLEVIERGLKTKLREEGIRGFVSIDQQGRLQGKFTSAENRDKAATLLRKEYPEIDREKVDSGEDFYLYGKLSDIKRKEIEDYAISQNLTTLRKRVNELGVSEPLVQRQGRNRIVVELPGIQDTAEAKRILGKTANLEFRLEADFNTPASDRERFEFRDQDRGESGAFLTRDFIVSGENVTNAQPGFDQNGVPEVNITLDSEGGQLMHRSTRNNINRRLGVLFIERKTDLTYTTDENGEQVIKKRVYDEEKIISLATIRDALGVQFRITGLTNPTEASELALLLRAGALAAPISYEEERTVGPSLGAENIALGVRSVQIGLGLVALFMLFYYRVFGIAAVSALAANIVLLIAAMSMLGATLTLPGIAGIVLTVGMAVDANVLIFSRIREELKNRMTPQQAIEAGYGRAFVTIVDANITTLIVAVILYAVGTGPVKGFAVTLSLGILTSMFTAIMGTRAIINLIYGGRKVSKLSI